MSDIVTAQTFTDGEKGITATKMNNIVAQSVIQPDFYNNKASSATLDPTDQLLELKGTGSYARITGSQLISSVSSQLDVTPQIYSTRLRSFNAVGNPNFEVDQRNCHTSLAAPPWLCDRWRIFKQGSMAYWAATSAAPSLVPGTNFQISNYNAGVQLTTVQASLAATDYWTIVQNVEGSCFRELASDVHSFSILAASSVANLKFGVAFQDPSTSISLTKLCSLGAANTPVLFRFPNLPVFPGAGTFQTLPGSLGMSVWITLAAGSTYTAPTNDTWQTGNFLGAVGQSNFAASAVNSTFTLYFIQHEPGAVCTTLMDKPFSGANGNLEECLRYFEKTYDYATKPGTITSNGMRGAWVAAASQNPYLSGGFKKTMATIPAVTIYSPSTGAINMVRNVLGSADLAASAYAPGNNGYAAITVTSPPGGVWLANWHHTADTGW